VIRFRVLKQVTLLTFTEFVRTPGSMFWTYGFPLIMALSLGLAFRSSEPLPLRVAVIEEDFQSAQLEALHANTRLAPVLLSAARARAEFDRGRYLVLVAGSLASPVLEQDPTRPESELAKLHVMQGLRSAAGDAPRPAIQTIDVVKPGRRYIDWLIPGLIGLNLLGAGLWGVGFTLVQMRVKNILRRMHVTPMRRSEFLLAFLLSRLFLVLPESAVILCFGAWVFGVPIVGSLSAISVLVVLGAASFTGLGLLLASRARTVETVSGMMNLTMLPMWLFGGCFFGVERFPDVVQDIIWILPINHFTQAMRDVMTEGASLFDAGVLPHVAFLAGFGVLTLGLAVRFFRWS